MSLVSVATAYLQLDGSLQLGGAGTLSGLGDPLAQHAGQRVGGKQAGPKWVEEGGLEKCLDPGTSVSTPGPR